MQKYGIVVDSTSSVSQELIEKYNIKVANLTITIGDKTTEYVSNEEVISSIKMGVDVKTSQPSPEVFKQKIEELFQEGYEEVLVITLSSTLSGTFNSANLAVSMLDVEMQNRTFVFDTESITMGALYYIELACKLFYEDKLNMVQTIKHLTKAKDQGHLVFVVDDLGTIFRQGRLGRIKYILGSILRVKPILVFDRNVLDIASRSARGFKGAFKFIEKRIQDFMEKNPGKRYVAWFAYIDEPKVAQAMYDNLKQSFDNLEVKWVGLGSHVVAAHVGPGGMGIYLAYED